MDSAPNATPRRVFGTALANKVGIVAGKSATPKA
eukprot:CAMPEP_0194760670 /NCGR_PEP_ID=MMETSP0323_2-20130528/13534_1 /TAXON_ID=2866 ORGANISM="Crypthecodinium cohnii, Strain Seligo" /NCGR_SAMPLE_ID=MMETSP0323_2 /ASSEMBLY_ACC=CAM_ASM_000346 /LENGTH=33 /DNA_ID= /DNA_START= /DNA_END= /DNA_ORIENTATION=